MCGSLYASFPICILSADGFSFGCLYHDFLMLDSTGNKPTDCDPVELLFQDALEWFVVLDIVPQLWHREQNGCCRAKKHCCLLREMVLLSLLL